MNIELSVSPFSEGPPFTINHVATAIESLPKRKAPGVDHLRVETLQPIQPLVAPLLFSLLHLCWKWSYTTINWRIAQVIPINKKGSPSEPSNYRPISLTSTFRKILDYCRKQPMQLQAPQLDIAQGGFGCSRSSLDQALCLSEICHNLKKQYKIQPTLAFLDIKSAYDTVDRDIVWRSLQSTMSLALLALLQNLFNDVHIEVLLSNASSYRFHPKNWCIARINIIALPLLLLHQRSTNIASITTTQSLTISRRTHTKDQLLTFCR